MLADLADLLSKLPPIVQIAVGMPAALLAVFLFLRGRHAKEELGPVPPLTPPHVFWNGPITSALEYLERVTVAVESRRDIEAAIRENKRFLMDRLEALEARTRKNESDIARIEGQLRARR